MRPNRIDVGRRGGVNNMVEPTDCAEKAHDKVRKAAEKGGWMFCPICEVAKLTAMVLEQEMMNKVISGRMDSILAKIAALEKAYRPPRRGVGS